MKKGGRSRPPSGRATFGAAPAGRAAGTQPPAQAIEGLKALFNAGRLQQAASTLSDLLKVYPQSFVLWNMAGVLHTRAGRADKAAEAFGRVTALRPDFAEGHNNLAAMHRELGAFEAAAASARRALKLRPDFAEAHSNLGNALMAQGKPKPAVASYRRALELRPDFADAHYNLGNALKELGQPDAAIASYRRAAELRPTNAGAHSNLGVMLQEQGQPEAAAASFQRAVEIRPDFAEAHSNLGNALRELGRTDAAAASYARALELRPDYAEAHFNLGNLFKQQGRLEEAAARYRRALAASPDHSGAHNNLGNTLSEMAQFEAAAEHYRRAIALQLDFAEAHNNLGVVLDELGQLEASLASHQRAVEIRPDYATARAQLLHQQRHACDWSSAEETAEICRTLGIEGGSVPPFAMLSLEDHPQRQKQRSVAHAVKAFQQVPDPLPAPSTAPGQKIRLGYFSADFHDHATLYLMAGLLRCHDRARFEIHAFSYGATQSGAWRERLQRDVDSFQDVRELPDAEVVELAHARGLDIAIDLKGYTKNSRSRLFAYRLAPLQVSYLGYPGTMGADFMDYMVADRTVVPERHRAAYSERVICLPDSYQPNDNARGIAEAAGTRADAGLPERALVFCCFNNAYKIGPREFDIWMRVLARSEGSVLWLLRTNPVAEANLRREAEARGIAAERLVFADRLPHREHLARHRHADLFLDTFAYNAHTTASDALWAGLPVVTMAGEQFAARVGASLLGAVGLADLVTDSEAAYEALIVELAENPARLSEIRARLGQNRSTQPLFDTERYTRHFEQAMEIIFRRAANGQAPVDIEVSRQG